jgi:hypothetical protein
MTTAAAPPAPAYQATAMAPRYTSAAPTGAGAGAWLAIVGSLMAILPDFLWAAYVRFYDGSAWTQWAWARSASLYWWKDYWSALFHMSGGWRDWVGMVGVALLGHAATAACVVVLILAVVRLGNGQANASFMRGLGILALIGAAVSIVWYGLFAQWSREIPVSNLAALVGAVLIVVGAGRTPAAAPSLPAGLAYGAPGVGR